MVTARRPPVLGSTVTATRGRGAQTGVGVGVGVGEPVGVGTTVPRSGPLSTASKALPGTVLSWFRSLSFQRGSRAPLMNQLDPLSARIMPYFFRALRITREWPVNPETLKSLLRRTRRPIGGKAGSVVPPAWWVAGLT